MDRRWVRSNSRNPPLSNFMQVSSNGHIRRTIIATTVRPAQPFWLSQTLFLRVSHFFPSVLQRPHATGRHPPDGPSFTTVLVVRDPISEGLSLFLSVLQWTHVTDRHPYDGPSYITVLVVRDPVPNGLSLFF